MIKKILLFLEKYSRREFWPGYIFDIPQYIYWFYLCIKARTLLFFSNVNPGMFLSGFAGYGKHAELEKIPDDLKPTTLFIPENEPLQTIKKHMQEIGISYPCIIKPDLGRTGRGVKKLHNDNELAYYCKHAHENLIIQEFIEYPLEFGVFYYRLPNEEKGHITGIVEKRFMFLEGNGTHTFGQLIHDHPRAKYYHDQMKQEYHTQRKQPIEKGKKIQLTYIGNHCRGSTFYDSSHLINPELEEVFDRISKQIDGFYFGRYDIKTESIDALFQGKMKIIELNGMGSLPTHIYDPATPLWKAYKEIFHHWDIAYKISKINHQRGFHYTSLKEVITIIKKYGI